jgi:hypothetical protein
LAASSGLGVLDIHFPVAIVCLILATGMLNFALQFQFLVADDLASDFLHFPFEFGIAASGLILVHGVLLSLVSFVIGIPVFGIPIAERTLSIKPGLCGSPHSHFLLNGCAGRIRNTLCTLARITPVRHHK